MAIKEPGSGPRISIWLSHQLIKVLRINAASDGVSPQKYVDELIIDWILFRREAEESEVIDVPYTYDYPYLMVPSRLNHLGEPKENFSSQTFYLNPNTASWMRKHAIEDGVKMPTILYTVLYIGLVGPSWFKYQGRWYSLRKNRPDKWPIPKED